MAVRSRSSVLLCEETVDEVQLVLDAFESVADHCCEVIDVAGSEVAQAVFMFAQTPSVGLSSGA